MGYPYPFFSYSWNRKLPYFAWAAFYLIALVIAVYFAESVGWIQGQYNISIGDMFEKSFLSGLIATFFFFSFMFGYFSFFTLWFSMWVYWARKKSFLWFFVLLFGFLGTAL